MNKAHRVVWSDALRAFVVTHEHASSRGKPSSARKLLVSAIALGVGGLMSPIALAAGNCANGGSTTIGSAKTVTCTLAAGGTLNINVNGSITAAPAVLVGANAAVATTGAVNSSYLIRNNGLIDAKGSGTAILLTDTAVSGSVFNSAVGVINDTTKAIALDHATLDGFIRNAGVIRASGTGIDVLSSVLAGNLDNRNAISANTGISVQDSTVNGHLLDSGNISSNDYAIYVDQSRIGGNVQVGGSAAAGKTALTLSNDTVGGSVVNSGSIWAQQTAVLIDNTQVSGNFHNTGTIAGSTGIKVLDGSSLGTLRNDGTVTGNDFALQISQAHLSGGLTNSGVLAVVAPNYDGAAYPNIGNGLDIQITSVAKDINNSGTISGGSVAGAGAHIGGSILGGNLINSGTITGVNQGLHLYSSSLKGSLTNSGVISADTQTGTGLLLTTDVLHGDIVNSGNISGGNGLQLNRSSLDGSIVNNGTLSGQAFTTPYSDGLLLTQTDTRGDIINNGAINGFYNAVGIYGSNIGGSFINNGSLSAGEAVVISNSTIAQNLVNNGTVGTPFYSYQLTGSNVGGQIQNTGSLGGALLVLNHSTVGKGIINSGTIKGVGGSAISVSDSLINSGGIVNNGGSVIGDSGGVTASNSTITGNIVNSGTLGISSNFTTATADGIRLQSSTLNGNVLNSGVISGYDGITLQQSTIIGNIDSSGTINGGFGAAINLNQSLLKGSLITEAGSAFGGRTGIAVTNSTITGQLISAANSETKFGNLSVNNSVISGGITNSGTLRSDESSNAIYNSTLGSFVNTGYMVGQGPALYLSGDQVTGGVTNSGTLVGLNLNNTTVKGTVLNSGTMSANSHGPVDIENGSSVGGILNTGTLINDGANAVPGPAIGVFDSAIGTGGISNSGTLTGDGGIALSNSSVAGDINNLGTITTGNSPAISLIGSTVAGSIHNAGVLNEDSGTGTLVVTDSTINGSINNSGLINGGVSISNSTLGGLVNSGTITGAQYAVLSDSSLTQLTITGDNTAVFNGAVQAAQAHVNVAQGAAYTLKDGNLFTVADFTNYGTLGLASNATATIAGNYIQATDATLSTQAVDASTFGKLVVTGTATLPDQAKFNVDVVNSGQSFSGATLANVLSAGTLNSNGTYAVTSNSALYNFSGVKDGNSVDLVAAPKSTAAVTQAVQGVSTANLSAARALDSALASNSSLTPFFVGATSGSQVASAISQTLPSNAAAATEVSQSTLSTIADVVQSRIDANTGLASGDGFYGDKNLWMKPFGSWINQSQHGNTPGYDATVYGMAFGLDAPVNELLRLGVSFSYANADTNSKADVSAQSAKVDLYQLMGYGSYTVAPNTELSFHAGVGQNRNDGKRDLNLNGVGGQAKSNYDSRTFTAGVALAKAYDISPTTRFIPSVRADYTYLKDDSYHESGSAAIDPLLLDVDKHQTDQLILGLDGKVSHEIIPGTQITGNLGVGYDVIHDDSMLTSSYAGAPGNTFNTVGQSSSPWLARGGVGVTTRIAQNGTELSVNYDAEARTDFTNQTVSLKLKVPF